MNLQSQISPLSSVYLHLPFCRQICYYCDFNKVLSQLQPIDEYIHALGQEMRLIREKVPLRPLETLYIGGGTPSLLNNKQTKLLFTEIRKNFTFATNLEFTIEANPEDINAAKISLWQDFGVNRVSLGVQTFDNAILRNLGRHHTEKDIEEAINLLKRAGFTNISLDLIYSLPNQTLTTLKNTLIKALAFDLPHYSIYSLIREPHTILNNLVQENKLKLPNDDEAAVMMEFILDFMSQSGLCQYEISNFAKAGFESLHNLVYWNNEHYLGLGAGASGYVKNVRYQNCRPIKPYLQALAHNKLPIAQKEELTLKNRLEEEMFLGLRKINGVSKKHFARKFGVNFAEIYGKVVKKLSNKGLLEETPDFVKLTRTGQFLGNDVFAEFLFE